MSVVLWVVGGLVGFLALAAVGTLFSLERYTDETGALRARVSKSSWLGRYYNIVAGWILSGNQWVDASTYPPRKLNFCKFFERLVICSLVNVFVVALVSFVLVSMIAFPYFSFVYGWEKILGNKEVVEKLFATITYGRFWYFLLPFGFIFWFFGVIGAVVMLVFYVINASREQFKSREPVGSVVKESTLGMWVRARKAKVCPTLEVVE